MLSRVCAIILDYFAASKTAACVRSLIGQGITTVYLVDNSGTELASTELRNVVVALQGSTDFEICTLSPGVNLGFAKGVNFALRHDTLSQSPHDYYLLLNNDAIAGPRLVTGLIQEINRDSQIALVSPKIACNNPGREYGIWYHRYLGLLLSRPRRFCFHYFTGCCLLFRKELIDTGTLFDEAFFMYGEDVELGWRIKRQGHKMLCAEEAVVEHEYGPSVDRASFFYEFHMARSHLLLCLKTSRHPIEIPLLLFFKFIGLSGRAIVRSLRYRTLQPILTLLLCWLPLRLRKL